MGKIEYLHIEVNKAQLPVYISGEQISGNVSLRIKERLKINFVVLTVLGQGRVAWYTFSN
jgi:hypothetical protein